MVYTARRRIKEKGGKELDSFTNYSHDSALHIRHTKLPHQMRLAEACTGQVKAQAGGLISVLCGNSFDAIRAAKP